MAEILKAGTKLNSAVCGGQVMVLRAPTEAVEISCGGKPMTTAENSDKIAIGPELAAGLLVGKRYVNEEDSLELLCTRGGEGSLQLGDQPLEIRQAKKLPSSD